MTGSRERFTQDGPLGGRDNRQKLELGYRYTDQNYTHTQALVLATKIEIEAKLREGRPSYTQ